MGSTRLASGRSGYTVPSALAVDKLDHMLQRGGPIVRPVAIAGVAWLSNFVQTALFGAGPVEVQFQRRAVLRWASWIEDEIDSVRASIVTQWSPPFTRGHREQIGGASRRLPAQVPLEGWFINHMQKKDFPVSTQYTGMVREYGANDSPEVFENASIGHALEIAKALFDSAERHAEDVRIVTGCLLVPFYDQLVKHAERVLAKASITVIVYASRDDEIVNSEFCKTVMVHDRGEVLFYPDGSGAHFILVGDSRYRLESDDSRATAFACFNDRRFGKFLLNVFRGTRMVMTGAN